MTNDDFFMLTLVCASSAIGLAIDHSRLGRQIPGALVMLVAGAVLSTLSVVPEHNSIDDAIVLVLLPLAITLFLMKSDVRMLWQTARGLLPAFGVAMLGTLAGVLTVYMVLPLQDDAAELAGVVTATLIGGSMNFFAVSEAVGFADSPLYAGALTADVIIGVVFLSLLFVMCSSTLLRAIVPSATMDAEAEASRLHDADQVAAAKLPAVVSIMLALAVASAIVWVSGVLSQILGIEKYRILVITVITVALASSFPASRQYIVHEDKMAMVMMYAFFLVTGASVDLGGLFGGSLYALLYYALVLGVHVGVLLVLGRWFKVDLAALLVASNACVLGPPTAAGMAASRGWHHLVLPGLLVGLFGYAVANFLGVGVTWLVGKF